MKPPLFPSRTSLAPAPSLLPVLLLLVALAVPGCSHDGEGDVHHDTGDWNIFIDDRTRRDTTDRFVLRFVKPRG